MTKQNQILNLWGEGFYFAQSPIRFLKIPESKFTKI